MKINNQIRIKILNNFSQILYKELNLSLDEFYFIIFIEPVLKKQLSEMFSDSSAKDIREFLFENLLIYKFFTFENYHKYNNKKAAQQLIDYIKSDGKINQNILRKNKLGFKLRRKKVSTNPNQMKLI